ncbi:MAG: TPM domain-containing protein [Granulosicoccus sp.]
MTFLNNDAKASLTAQIQQAESRTHGEIMTVIAQQSDGYRYIPILWAALFALSMPGFYFLWEYLTADGWHYPGQSLATLSWLYPVQVLVFLGLGMLSQIPRCRMWVIPTRVKHQRAARHAREQFFLQELHLTENRTGVLVFVSVAEHYVEIIVDTGIAAKVDNAIWDETVQEFIVNIKSGQIAKGFENTIEHIREVLWQHFPAESGRPDQLPNHLIEV